MSSRLPRPDVAIIGYGAFGQFLARHLCGHARLRVCDPHVRTDDFPPVDLAQAADADIVILAIPLAAFEPTLRALAPHLRPGAIVIDVASVKLRPAALMQALLPDHVQLIASHPLFGPQSAADGLAGHRIARCPLRGRAHLRLAAFLRQQGLRVHLTTPDQHDRDMAIVQGLTHLIARTLAGLGPLPNRLTTASFRRLTEAAAMVAEDSSDLLRMILSDNPYADQIREQFLTTAAQIASTPAEPVSELAKPT